MEEIKIPNYVIKQIIAKEIDTRNHDVAQQFVNTNSQSKSKTNIKRIFDDVKEMADFANQIRFGHIPLEQCLKELTLDEKKNVYKQCEEWYEKNKEKLQEPEI